MTPPPPLTRGLRIGNYLLDELAGQGAFAQVWKAHHHQRPGRTVAVKIPTEPNYSRQLAREGRLRYITHPHVVPILDQDANADIPYIVMPFLAGGSLADLVAKHPQGLPEDRVEAIMSDVLAGLAEAQRCGLIHRDLKPSNILLDECGRALLSDFGLSAGDGSVNWQQSVRQSLSLAADDARGLTGTLAYLAPEVREGEPATAASDVYAVGVVLFELLTGRRPAGLELPSRRRPNLAQAKRWDELYYGSCCPAENRYSTAELMLKEIRKPTEAAPMVAPVREVPAPGPEEDPARAVPAILTSAHKTCDLALDLGGGVRMEMILIPADEFMMGAPDAEEGRDSDDGPQHHVRISRSYYMGRYAVTQVQWQAIMGQNPAQFRGAADMPVDAVTWKECCHYLALLARRFGRAIRLPREAEWEYACRAGRTTRFSFGESEDQLGEYAWYRENSDASTHVVGGKRCNPWGLYDMHGNVWEWCADWHGVYEPSSQVDPRGREPGRTGGPRGGRVLRGGSWRNTPQYLRSAERFYDSPDARNNSYGFRCVVEAE